MTLTLRQLRQFLPAVPIRAAGDFLLQGMSIDTRTLAPNNLYVALTGRNVDGHHYIEKAAELGASAALVDHWVEGVQIPQIKFEDCEKGMGSIARVWREIVNPTVIAITGSNGKTTVKQMLGKIFTSAYSESEVLITHGNLNNQQGVPLTLSRLSETTKVAIVEHGANHHQEIAYLSSLSKPDVAVITNAGPAHLEGFGDVEGVAKAKGELIDGLSEQGVVVLNADDEHFAGWKSRANQRRVISFGFANDAIVKVSDFSDGRFKLSYQDQSVELKITAPGSHNALNVAAATAAAVATGLPFEASANAAVEFVPVKGRFALVEGYEKAYLINDSYNANPNSVTAGIKSLPSSESRWLALGSMGELGESSEYWHKEIARVAKEAGIEKLFCFGQETRATASAFGEGALLLSSHEELVSEINAALLKATEKPWVLVKGSLTSEMSKVITMLKETEC